MNAVTAHRGPEGSRILELPGVTFGFNRLAVIDLDERSMQPLMSASGRYTIVCNGELYNYRELKGDLDGYPFKTEGDTEVILAGLERFGIAFLGRLNGMFDFALWDAHEHELVLVRDPAGVKPLYYAMHGGELFFSTEMRALIEAGVPRTVDQESLGHYLRFMYVPKERTMFAAIKKVLPGHALSYKNKTIIHRPYHSSFVTDILHSYADAVAAVRSRVSDAIERQLVSDRPVGVYLSGGIDSSVVVSQAVRVHPNINTYSIGFELEESEDSQKFNADANLARETAKYFSTKHHDFRLRSTDVAELFPKMIAALDAPIGNATTLAQFYLAEQTKPTATVVLSGEGGDELFGGYERYRLAHLAAWARVPRALSRFLPGRLRYLGFSGVERYLQLMAVKDSVLQPMYRTALPDSRSLFEEDFSEAGEIVDQLMRVDERNWLVDEALLRADLMSMAASVEQRVPFLDLEVRALAHALPRSYKVTGRNTKRILKDAFRDVLPGIVLNQPKRGWFSPGAKWLRRPEFVALTREVFSDGYTEASALFNLDAVRAYESAHRARTAYHYTELWATLVFLAWARRHRCTV